MSKVEWKLYDGYHCGRRRREQKEGILRLYLAGVYKPDDTLMVATPAGTKTKTFREWLTEWGLLVNGTDHQAGLT